MGNEAIASSSISTTSLPSCSTIQKSALELLSSDATITSPSYLLPRSSNWKCSLEDSCTDCLLNDDGLMHTTTCSDGCSYSFDGLTVTRTISISNSASDSSIQPTTVTSAHKLLDGGIGDFDIKLLSEGEETNGPSSCKADFLDNPVHAT